MFFVLFKIYIKIHFKNIINMNLFDIFITLINYIYILSILLFFYSYILFWNINQIQLKNFILQRLMDEWWISFIIYMK
jgi:hypothetical protein